MKRRSTLGLIAVVLTAWLAIPAPTPARQGFAPDPGRVTEGRRTQISLGEAVERVRRQTGGRILSAETVRRDNRVTHRIKVLLPSGHVRIFHVDAGAG